MLYYQHKFRNYPWKWS